MMIGKWLARTLISLAIRLSTRLEIIGQENIQGIENGIFVGNHIGRLDGLLVYYMARQQDAFLLVAEKYQKVAWIRWFVKRMDGIFVDRYNADFTVLREVLRRLKKGGILAISPEGTRSPDAALQKAWPGASFIALKSGVPVVPIGITGCEDSIFFSNLRKLRRTLVIVRMGKPFFILPLGELNRQAEIQRHTDEIMCRIAALLPPSYRGIYADHPRLRELLAVPKSPVS